MMMASRMMTLLGPVLVLAMMANQAWAFTTVGPRSSFSPAILSSTTNDDDSASAASSDASLFKGTVKWFDTKKGFGFLTREDGEDFFVHQSSVQADGFRDLEDGTAVEFKVETNTDNGRTSAVNVTGPDGKAIPRGYAYKKRDE
jgi:CspA family cold shock protein